MSLSQSLHNAVSGLTANARGAETIAANLANLHNTHYGRRDLVLSSIAPSGGVEVVGVLRHENPVLLSERRLAQATTAAADLNLAFHKGLEVKLGLPHEAGSLTATLGQLDAALSLAANNPSSEAHLHDVLHAADALASRFAEASQYIQSMRQTADLNISKDVATLNDTLSQVASLNRDIVRLTSIGKDVSGLIDQRQMLIDRVAEIIPLREISKDGKTVALYTMGGAALLDGPPAVFSFTPSSTIAPESGALSGLTLNGRAISTSASGVVGGGRLTAQFALRDEIAPQAQHELDEVALDIAMRLQQADTTRSPSSPGLLSDQGGVVAVALSLGLSARLQLAPQLNPAEDGDLWRLRSGIGASAPGPAGDGRLLDALAEALRLHAPPVGTPAAPDRRTAAGLIGELVSRNASSRLGYESQKSFALARQSALEQAQAQEGVDSDDQLQMLLSVEKAYAANARVIATVDEMLENLLRI